MTPELFKEIRRIQFKMQKIVQEIFQGAYKSRFKGRGMEFEEVREFVDGDEVRTIDWNVTARMQKPYIKTFTEERELSVMLLVDLSSSCSYGTTLKDKKKILAELGALFAFSAFKNNDKVGLILFSDRIELYVPPKKGIRHVLRLIREILALQPKGKKTDLKGALSYLGRIMTKPCICFLLSDFIAENYERELKLTAKRHDLIGLRIFDEREISFPKLGLIELTDLETGEVSLIDSSSEDVQNKFNSTTQDRSEKTKHLFAKSGAPLIEINTSIPYIEPLEKFFKAGKFQKR